MLEELRGHKVGAVMLHKFDLWSTVGLYEDKRKFKLWLKDVPRAR